MIQASCIMYMWVYTNDLSLVKVSIRNKLYTRPTKCYPYFASPCIFIFIYPISSLRSRYRDLSPNLQINYRHIASSSFQYFKNIFFFFFFFSSSLLSLTFPPFHIFFSYSCFSLKGSKTLFQSDRFFFNA